MLAIPFLVWIAAMLIVGMALTAKTWANPFAHMFAGGRSAGLLGWVTLAGRLVLGIADSAINYITHELTKAASHYTHPLARWFDALSGFVVANAVATGLFAERTAIGFERMVAVVIPREVGKVRRKLPDWLPWAVGLGFLTPLDLRLLFRGIDAFIKGFGSLDRAHLRRLAQGIDRLVKEHVGARLHVLERAVDTTIPREIARAEAEAEAFTRARFGKLAARLDKLAALLGVAYLTGLLVKVLAKRFPWLFCRKVKSVGNRVCGLDGDLLNSLILDTVLIGGTISIVEFARELQSLELGAASIIRGFIRDA